MSDTSRRNFLSVAGAGAAAGAVALAAGGAQVISRLRGDSAKEPVVAHIADHKAATMTLMVGEREVLVKDRDLVIRLLNAAGGK